jgi:signal transduction histidine kinase
MIQNYLIYCNSIRQKVSWSKLFIAVIFCCFINSINANEKNILVIHSYHQGLEWTDSISSGIFSGFKDHAEYKIHFKYLDTKIYDSEDYLQALVNLYKTQIANIRYEAIIASDNAAFDFLCAYRDTLFPGIPVFYCGVNFLDKEKLKQNEDFYGYEEVADHRSTIEMMLKFFPKRRKVLIINDHTLTGQAIKKELTPVLKAFDNRLEFELFDIFSIEELTEKVRTLSDDYLIYLLVVNKDRTGKFISYNDGIQLIKKNTSVPIFGTWDFYLGKGIVGGSITRGSEQGKNVAQMTIDYFSREGASPSAHQIGENTLCVDYRVMEYFGIEDLSVENDVVVINRPQIWVWQIRNLKIAVVILAVLLFITVLYLMFRKVQNKRLKQLVEERTTELKNINRNLEELNQSKNEILGVVAHDLRNPIGNISGFCNYIIDEDNEKPMLEGYSRICLDTISELSNFMLGMVDNLLDISVIESGLVKLNLTTQDYFRFIEKEIFQNKTLAEKKEIKIELKKCEWNLPLTFDKLKMQQVFMNLVANAIKYSKPGDTIKVEIDKVNDVIVTKVSDSGPGIPEDKKEIIFGKFVQLNNNVGNKIKGAGLGLSIVKGIIEAHNGKIYVESELNVGTTFFYELPLN